MHWQELEDAFKDRWWSVGLQDKQLVAELEQVMQLGLHVRHSVGSFRLVS